MNAMTLAFITMLDTLHKMVAANLSRFTVIKAFESTYAEITTRHNAMLALKPIAVETTKSQTAANLALKLKLCKKTDSVAGTVRSLAGKLGDVALKQEMDVKAYKLDDVAAAMLIPICRNVHTTATAHKAAAEDYGLTQTLLDELDTLILAYTAEVPGVRTGAGKINTAKADIERLKAECNEIFDDQLDPMINILLETDPTAVELWKSARVIVDPPSTTTQAKYKVIALDNGVEVPTPNAPITATGKITYTAITNEFGEAFMKPINHGTYTITVNMPGFLPFLLKDYKMVRGKINRVQIVLVREG